MTIPVDVVEDPKRAQVMLHSARLELLENLDDDQIIIERDRGEAGNPDDSQEGDRSPD